MNSILRDVGNFKPIRSFFWAVTISLVLCTSSYAVPLSYSLHGYLVDDQGQQNQVSGSMVIDNTLLIDATSSQYSISQFSLSTQDFSFQGNIGTLWFQSSDITTYPCDAMWGLSGTIGADTYAWVGEEFKFFNSDGTPYDHPDPLAYWSQYVQLAPIIELWGPDYNTGGPFAFNGDVIATLNPVPERSSIFLMIFGLVILASAWRMKFFSTQH